MQVVTSICGKMAEFRTGMMCAAYCLDIWFLENGVNWTSAFETFHESFPE